MRIISIGSQGNKRQIIHAAGGESAAPAGAVHQLMGGKASVEFGTFCNTQDKASAAETAPSPHGAARRGASSLICEGAFQFLQRHHQLKHLLFGQLQLRFQFGLRIHQLQQIIFAAGVIYSAVRQLIFNSG